MDPKLETNRVLFLSHTNHEVMSSASVDWVSRLVRSRVSRAFGKRRDGIVGWPWEGRGIIPAGTKRARRRSDVDLSPGAPHVSHLSPLQGMLDFWTVEEWSEYGVSQLPWQLGRLLSCLLITLCTWSRARGVVASRRAKLSALARPGVRVGPTVGYIVISGVFRPLGACHDPGAVVT